MQKKMLYLVQHGEAKSKEEDPERSLTEKGRRDVKKVAVWAAQTGLRIEQIRHSGKRRAAETAEIFAKKLNLKKNVSAVSGIAPNDDVEPVASILEQEGQSIMIVGHLPFLNRLASRLLVGNSERTVVRFRNGGVVGLSCDSGNWSVALLVPGDLN